MENTRFNMVLQGNSSIIHMSSKITWKHNAMINAHHQNSKKCSQYGNTRLNLVSQGTHSITYKYTSREVWYKCDNLKRHNVIMYIKILKWFIIKTRFNLVQPFTANYITYLQDTRKFSHDLYGLNNMVTKTLNWYNSI